MCNKSLLFIIITSLLSGCATTYAPIGNFGGFEYGGYADTRLNGDTAVVRFSGNTRTSMGKVTGYMLYRCAQVTANNGYDYFVVTSTTNSPLNIDVDTETSFNHYQVWPPKMYNSYYQTTRIRSFEFSPTLTPDDNHKYHGSAAVIKMFNGKPWGVPNAFSARDVLAHYGPATF